MPASRSFTSLTSLTSLAILATLIAVPAFAQQQPQTVRLRGTIEKIDGHTVLAKSDKGAELKLEPRRQGQ